MPREQYCRYHWVHVSNSSILHLCRFRRPSSNSVGDRVGEGFQRLTIQCGLFWFACPFVCLPPWPQTPQANIPFKEGKSFHLKLGKMDRQFSKRLGKSGASSGAAGSAKGATDGKRPPSSPARGVSPVRRCYYYRHNTKPSSLLSSPRPSLTL